MRAQVALIPHTQQLVTLGVPLRPLAALRAQLAGLLADEDACRLPYIADTGLTAEELATLRSRQPTYKRLCDELAACGLPDTLEHGDLWPANIIATATGHIFFDWSDACVGHPIFSALLMLEDRRDVFPAAPDGGTRLRDAYLAPWAAFAPPERLLTAYELAQQLAPLHYAWT